MNKIYTSDIGDNKIIVLKIKDGSKIYLPPIRKNNFKTKVLPQIDFNLFGEAIVGNLGFSELSKKIAIS